MEYYDAVPMPGGAAADFAVTLTDNSLAPLFSPGETVYLRRRADLRDGDVGLFFLDGRLVFRQLCADSFGTVYLFAVDRKKSEEDRVFSCAEAEELVCYGKVVLSSPLPLPSD